MKEQAEVQHNTHSRTLQLQDAIREDRRKHDRLNKRYVIDMNDVNWCSWNIYRLQELEDRNRQKMRILQEHEPHAFNAYQWLRKNEDKFKRKVYGPLFLEVDVPEPLHARYIEHICPHWLLVVSNKMNLS